MAGAELGFPSGIGQTDTNRAEQYPRYRSDRRNSRLKLRLAGAGVHIGWSTISGFDRCLSSQPGSRYDLDTHWMLLADSFNESVRTPIRNRFRGDSATFNHVFDQRPNDSMTDSNWSDAKIRSISSVRRIDERLVMLNSIVPCSNRTVSSNVYFERKYGESILLNFSLPCMYICWKGWNVWKISYIPRWNYGRIKYRDFLGLTRISRDT